MLSLRRALRHALYDLRDGFLTRPLVIVGVLALAGVLLPLVEARWQGLHTVVSRMPVLVPRDPATAQAILGAIAGAIMTVVSIVLSVLLVALTLASMQFSPRILTGFIQDRTNQHTVGLFLGTFLYCLCGYPAARPGPPAVVPCVTVLGAMVLVLACIVWLLRFVRHIAQSINASHIADRIARETERVVDAVMAPLSTAAAWPEVPPPTVDRGPASAQDPHVAVAAGTSGYIRYVDIPALVNLAHERGTSVQVLRRVGQFVPAGTVLLRVPTRRSLSPEFVTELLGAFDIGPTRTLEQDVEFGILQLVDIALKAISPAVNDPSTAINCIDQLSRVLVRVATRQPAPTAYYHPPGVLRLVLTPSPFAQLVETAFGQIRAYGRTDLAVTLRLLRALGDIASVAGTPAYRATLRAQAERIASDHAHFTATETADIHARLDSVRRFTAPEG